MPRSIKKGPFVDRHLFDKCLKARKTENKKIIKTWSRRSMILPEFVGLHFAVHNGNKFIPVRVNESMVGYKLGEFSPTRTYRGHTSKTSDRKKSKK